MVEAELLRADPRHERMSDRKSGARLTNKPGSGGDRKSMRPPQKVPGRANQPPELTISPRLLRLDGRRLLRMC